MIYHIKRGNHYCEETHIQQHDGRTSWGIRCSIPKEWLTDFKNKKYNQQSSKIEGISFGIDNHRDSIRTALRPVFDKTGLIPQGYFAILAYFYNHGVRQEKFLFHVNVDEVFEYYITIDKSKNCIYWDSSKMKDAKKFTFGFNGVVDWGLEQYNYFGGTQAAPCDLTLKVERI